MTLYPETPRQRALLMQQRTSAQRNQQAFDAWFLEQQQENHSK